MLALIFLLLLLPRLWIVFNSSYTFYSDDAIYVMLAKFWSEGNWQKAFHPTWPPLYPTLTAVFSYFTPDWETAARLVALLAGISLIIPLFFLLKKTTSFWIAVSFVLSLSLFTPLLIMSLMALSDSLAVLLIISGIVATFFGLINLPNFNGIKLLLLGSFFFGLVYLTRAEGTMFFFLTTIYLVIYFLIKRQVKLLVKIIFPFIVIFLLTVSPYVITTRMQIGEWSLSQKFSAQIQQGHAFALNSRGTTWAQEVTSAKSPNYQSPYFKRGSEFVIDHLYTLLYQYSPKLQKWEKVFLSIFPLWSIILMLVGIISLFKKPFFWSVFYLVFIIATTIPITVFSTPIQDVRYLAWTIPLFLYFFYLGVRQVVRKKFVAIFAFLWVLFFPGVSINYLINPREIAVDFGRSYDMNELRVVGLWIKSHSPHSNPRVMLRHEGVENYAQGETIYMPQIPLEEMLNYAKRNKVDYVVAWENELAADPNLSFLLDDKINHPGLEQVFSPTSSHRRIIVYKLISK